MTAVLTQALPLWGLDGSEATLIAARENAVYRVEGPDGPVALRLHRSGYRTAAELRSELQWMDAVKQGGLMVPEPVPALDGALLHEVDGVQVDVLAWLSGTPFAEEFPVQGTAERCEVFRQMGAQMALLHQVSDAWTPPAGFTRHAWDLDGLLGAVPVWGRFWDNPELSQDDARLMRRVRERASAELASTKDTLDFGLIHADLVPDNVLVDGDTLRFIDFDDGGYGFRLFELATTLLKFMPEPEYPRFKNALIEGYTTRRRLNIGALDLFLLLRATTYVGWNITRMQEDGAQGRNTRFIDTARTLALTYLNT